MKRDPKLSAKMKRENPFCLRCGGNRELHSHHVIPISEGGSDNPSNIVVLCGHCHWEWHHSSEGKIDFYAFLETMPGWMFSILSENPVCAAMSLQEINKAFQLVAFMRSADAMGFFIEGLSQWDNLKALRLRRRTAHDDINTGRLSGLLKDKE